MNLLRLGVLSAAALLCARAAALPAATTFTLDVPHDADPGSGTRVGSVSFELDGDTGEACRYWAEWDNRAGTLAADCWLAEAKTHGHRSCRRNAEGGVDTMVTLDASLPCAGFDAFGAALDVFMLVAIEASAGPTFIGLVQWSAAGPYLSPIEARPYP